MFYCYLLVGSHALMAQQLSPADAATQARSATNGKVLNVKKTQGGKIDYRVKILSPEGRIRHIIVDGDSGEVGSPRKKAPHQKPNRPQK